MERNELYLVFLKVSQLYIPILGGGNVAEEKLTFLLKSSPDAKVEMASPMYREGTIAIANKFNVKMQDDLYDPKYLGGRHMVVATNDNVSVNEQIYHHRSAQQILVRMADNPPFCDFYMGGIATKGNVKIAISTNGKSPTATKRLRQFF